ncbi:hypothetical protein SynA18461_02218 [Synechococcus sp. A18-46.1]|nr:hypothetical protein SynA18461_02218 [Synechococcus sp. A18-46.1]
MAGRDGSWQVFGWLPFLLSAHYLQLFANDLSGFALNHSPVGELFAHTMDFSGDCSVGTKARLVVDALLEDFVA